MYYEKMSANSTKFFEVITYVGEEEKREASEETIKDNSISEHKTSVSVGK